MCMRLAQQSLGGILRSVTGDSRPNKNRIAGEELKADAAELLLWWLALWFF